MIFRTVCYCICNRFAANSLFLFYFCYFVHFLWTFSKKVRLNVQKVPVKNGYIPFFNITLYFFHTVSPKNKSVSTILSWVEYFKPLFTNKVQTELVSLAKIGRVNLGFGANLPWLSMPGQTGVTREIKKKISRILLLWGSSANHWSIPLPAPVIITRHVIEPAV